MNIIQRIKYISRVSLPCLLLASAVATPGCITKTDSGGYVNDIDIKDEIKTGQTTRDQVSELLGSPSAKSSFGSEVWYYISERTESVAFFRPEVTDQRVTRVEFDNAGVVSSLQQMSMKDSKEFSIAKRTTPTEGHSMGIMEQLLGNVGRFNSPAQRRPGSVPGSPGTGR